VLLGVAVRPRMTASMRTRAAERCLSLPNVSRIICDTCSFQHRDVFILKRTRVVVCGRVARVRLQPTNSGAPFNPERSRRVERGFPSTLCKLKWHELK
jgi:hypothetical protein